MKKDIVSKRYAKAIFDLAYENGEIDPVGRDMLVIAEIIKQVPYFIRAFSDDKIDIKKRINLLAQILKTNNICKTVMNFLKVLIERERFDCLTEILLDFSRRYDHIKNISKVDAYVADISLSQKVKTNIEGILNSILKMDSICSVKEDKSLIAGLTIKIGDVVCDSSVRGGLQRMREEFLKVR